jgi:hypothetical protein
MNSSQEQNQTALRLLQDGVEQQRAYLQSYEKPSEPLTYETIRTFDDLFCRDLMEPGRRLQPHERDFRILAGWGVNNALNRIIPSVPQSQPFRDFSSRPDIQMQADDFVLNCGTLALGDRHLGWLKEGILTAERHEYPDSGLDEMKDILILRGQHPSYFDEDIGRAGLSWSSKMARAKNRGQESRLEQRHRKMEPDLRRRVDLVDGWRMTYSSTKEIDQYFEQWARIYLNRIYSQDMVGPDDMIGGRPFSRYIDVLVALSGRSQKHIAYSAILLSRFPGVHIRNLLTTSADRDSFLNSLADHLGAGREEIEEIMSSFVLSGKNLVAHTENDETAWPPAVQASNNTLILPVFGLDINPFLFLLKDLRTRYEKDWFTVANNRERRWIGELETLFTGPRWQTHSGNLRLRDGKEVLTDIDFAIFDRKTNELALLQLKWQFPVGVDNRSRRSAGKNLVTESNTWIAKVAAWLDKYGGDELMRRLGMDHDGPPTIHIFVLARYHAYIAGYDERDDRALWSDWANFKRIRVEGPRRSISQLMSSLRVALARARDKKTGESIMFPLGSTAVLVNPSSVPDDNT